MNNKSFKVRDRRNRGWFYLDNDYLNGYAKIFGPIGTGIYLSLCRHVDGGQKCFPSEKTMADELNIGERTVRKYLKQLEAWNLIVIEKTRSDQGKFLHNVYWLSDKTEWKKKPSANGADGTESAKPTAHDDRNHRHDMPHKDTHEKNTHIKKTHLSDAGISAFDSFWESYPRKVAKGVAIKAWEKILPSEESISEIMAALERHKQSDQWTRDEGRFIPYPATWLNQGRWNDELKISKVGSKYESVQTIKA